MANNSKVKLQTIKCPKCGKHYLPAEIYYPAEFFGKPACIERNDKGEVEFFNGESLNLSDAKTHQYNLEIDKYLKNLSTIIGIAGGCIYPVNKYCPNAICIPSSVNYISTAAIKSKSNDILNIYLPSNCKNIQPQAFQGALLHVYTNADKPQSGWQAGWVSQQSSIHWNTTEQEFREKFNLV